MDGVRDNDMSERHEAVEFVIEGLYDGLGFESDSAYNLCDTFWSEWTGFSNQMGKFSSKRMWNSWPVIEGESYIWHERYSLKVTDVLGYVACRVTSNVLGIGAAESSWGVVKQNKSDKRADKDDIKTFVADDIGIESVECQSVIFGAALLHEARVIHKNAETVEGVEITYLWTDEDAIYDVGLGKFGIYVEEIQRSLPPLRVLRGWLEDSETGLLKKNDQLAEAKLLKKYEGLQLYDPQHDVKYTLLSFNLEFVRDCKSRGWSILVAPP
jgi:hypothetical protein